MPATPYKDEPGIADAEKLWRRTCPMWVIPDDNHGGWTVSSAASDASSDGSPLSMSILIARLAHEAGRRPHDVISDFPGWVIGPTDNREAPPARV